MSSPETRSHHVSDAFEIFQYYTDQKTKHCIFMRELFKSLYKNKVIDKRRFLSFIDFGCGDGKSSADIMKELAKLSPVLYTGIDNNLKFIQSVEKAARAVSGKNIISNVITGDIFDASSLPLKRRNNSIAYIGHALYYGGKNGEHLGALVKKIEDILGENAVCVTAHNAKECELAAIRKKYSKNTLAHPAAMFAKKAQAYNMNTTEITTSATLSFPHLSAEERNNISNPGQWHLYKRPEFSEMLQLISFITQQKTPAPNNHSIPAKQKHAPRLTQNELNDVVNDIYEKQYNKKYPTLRVVSCYQIFTPTNRDHDISVAAGNALTQAKAAYEQILTQSSHASRAALKPEYEEVY